MYLEIMFQKKEKKKLSLLKGFFPEGDDRNKGKASWKLRGKMTFRRELAIFHLSAVHSASLGIHNDPYEWL